MKVIALALAAAVTLVAGFATPAEANTTCTSQTYGNQTYTNCSDGTSYTTQTYGNQTYTSGSDGDRVPRSGV